MIQLNNEEKELIVKFKEILKKYPKEEDRTYWELLDITQEQLVKLKEAISFSKECLEENNIQNIEEVIPKILSKNDSLEKNEIISNSISFIENNMMIIMFKHPNEEQKWYLDNFKKQLGLEEKFSKVLLNNLVKNGYLAVNDSKKVKYTVNEKYKEVK